jgi:hypothetical protein
LICQWLRELEMEWSLQWTVVLLNKLNVVAEEAQRSVQLFVLREWLTYIAREGKSAELSRAG